MTLLKQSDKYEEAQSLYAELWTELSDVDEAEAQKLLHSFFDQINLVQAKKQSLRDFKKFVKSPSLYLALIIGFAIPLTMYVVFIYTSLSLE
ncbi:hypothetical protein D3C85_1624360 [compost metagenome]